MKTLLALIVATLATAFTGCIVERPHEHRYGGEYGYYQPGVQVQPVFEDDYVYYPRYQVYYGNRSHRYYYRRGASWEIGLNPPGIHLSALLAAPSIHLDFHDHPSHHHAEVIRRYPKNWHHHDDDHRHHH